MANTCCLLLVFFFWFCFSFLSSSSSSSSSVETISSHLQLDSSALCGLVDCVNGDCVSTSSVPFFRCQCHTNWTSPFNLASMPCVLPNCTINLGCSNSSEVNSPPPSPPSISSAVCSSNVCGNGDCFLASNSSTSYECRCNPGYTNMFNTSNGYCLPQCAIGADCKDLNIPLIGISPAPPSPPPAPSTSESSMADRRQTPLLCSKMMLMTSIHVGALLLFAIPKH